MRCDVLVVGGGLAGCAVAHWLVEAGVHAVVIEKHQFPRHKVCGEGLMPHGVQEFRRLGWQDLLSSFPKIEGVEYHHKNHHAQGRFPSGFGRGVYRQELDASVLQKIKADGIEVFEGSKFTKASGVPGAFFVQTKTERFQTRVIVGADGLHSRVRRWADLHKKPQQHRRYGVRAHFRCKKKLTHVQVFVCDEGEIYLTPVADGLVNVAALLSHSQMRPFRGDLSGGLRHLAGTISGVRDRVDLHDQQTEASATGPLRQEVKQRTANGVVLVGDAGGFRDAITGEGMSISLTSARLAAASIVSGLKRGRLDEKSLGAFERELSHAFRDINRLCSLSLFTFTKPTLANLAVRLFAHEPSVLNALLAVNCRQQDIAGALKEVLWRDRR